MINFFKKMLGLPSDAEKQAAEKAAQAPYKVEKPEDQRPAVTMPSTGGVKAFKPKAPKKSAGKPTGKPKAKKTK